MGFNWSNRTLHSLQITRPDKKGRPIPVGIIAAGIATIFVLLFEWDARRFLAQCGWQEAANPRWGFVMIAAFVFLCFGNWLSSYFQRRLIRWASRAIYVTFWGLAIGRMALVANYCSRMPSSCRYLCSVRLEALWLAQATYYDVCGRSAVVSELGDQVSVGQWRVRVLPYNVLAAPATPLRCLSCENPAGADDVPQSPPVAISAVCPEHLRCPCEPGPITASSFFAVLPPSPVEAKKYALAMDHGPGETVAHTRSNEYKARRIYPIVELPGYGNDWRTDGAISFGMLCDLVFIRYKADNGCLKSHVHSPLAISVSGEIVDLRQIRTAREMFQQLFDGE